MGVDMKAAVAVAVGGALGSLARYWLTLASVYFFGQTFPWGTLGINVLGSFVIGFVFVFTAETGSVPASATTRLFVMTGLCGGFTTFSAFSLQTLQLIEERAFVSAAGYVAASVILCVAAAALGWWAAGGSAETF